MKNLTEDSFAIGNFYQRKLFCFWGFSEFQWLSEIASNTIIGIRKTNFNEQDAVSWLLTWVLQLENLLKISYLCYFGRLRVKIFVENIIEIEKELGVLFSGDIKKLSVEEEKNNLNAEVRWMCGQLFLI